MRTKRERGAVAIEFAMTLPILLGVFYAICSYGMVFMFLQSFTYAAEDALRAAIAVDCQGLSSNQCVSQRITPAARTQAQESLAWLPNGVREQVLGSNGENVQITCTNDTCTAEVRFNGYRAGAPLPAIDLPFIGSVPRLPQDLVGRASLRM